MTITRGHGRSSSRTAGPRAPLIGGDGDSDGGTTWPEPVTDERYADALAAAP
ncbi:MULTISPECIES: hypothetical protein [unclassified Streptomyces]|uniref:hypothetical protein n=1 Tax=unclassified Streptomyces TaxID=2593676 RepID=UPI002E27DBAD|nr:hypothetical protein [Streptomyces sp. NBC_00223]